MYLPSQSFLHFWSSMFGHDSVVAGRVTEVQSSADSYLVPFRKSSARRPQLYAEKFQSVASFYNEVVLGMHGKFQLV